ncbi:DUF1194 domain-containing protein [Bradyrhizobium sp. ma5]|uniref:DUF1194 domain-containing protein n=1 Tax=Bradyrhizobium sp. ma5 TaxID=3344828 RepID=UPI0035D48631
MVPPSVSHWPVLAMRWAMSIGAILIVGAISAGAAGPRNLGSQQSNGGGTSVSVDLELVIAVDVSCSMDMDELAVQREGSNSS